MRPNATRRPPASTTAALTLMLSCCAFATAPATMRLASSSVRLIDPSLIPARSTGRGLDSTAGGRRAERSGGEHQCVALSAGAELDAAVWVEVGERDRLQLGGHDRVVDARSAA